MKRLVLPIPPSVNHSHRNIKQGKRLMRVKTEEAKQFLHDAHWLAFEWMQTTGWEVPEAGEKIILRYWVYWKNNQRRDTDNIAKLLQDSLTDVLYVDDRYVLPQAMDYSVDKQNPRLEIELEVKKEPE